MHAYKSEVVIFSASHQHPNDRRGRVKSLGVTIDSHLRFDCHASDVECACNHHTRALRHVRSLLSDEVAQTVACSIVASRLDYCNALLYGAHDGGRGCDSYTHVLRWRRGSRIGGASRW